MGLEDMVIKINLYRKTKELGRLIGKDGTLEILDLLDERPRQYKEIDINIEMTHATLLRRLKKLQILDLFKKKSITSKRRETHVYDFTFRGIELMKFINAYEKEMKLPIEQQKIINVEEK